MSAKNDSRLRRARRSRARMRTLGVNRLSVHRTPRHIYAQVIAPEGDKVLASASTLDGDLRKGIKWTMPRFVINGDGTVTDNLTGLIWLADANCAGTTMIFDNALSFANTLADGSGCTPGPGDLPDGFWFGWVEGTTGATIGHTRTTPPPQRPFRTQNDAPDPSPGSASSTPSTFRTSSLPPSTTRT